MLGLRVELFCERDDPVPFHAKRGRAEFLPHREILEIVVDLSHACFLSSLGRFRPDRNGLTIMVGAGERRPTIHDFDSVRKPVDSWSSPSGTGSLILSPDGRADESRRRYVQ